MALELKDLTIHYHGKERPALENCSLALHRGQCLAVVGRSGAGKSSLLNTLTGVIAPKALQSGTLSLEQQTIFSKSATTPDLSRDFHKIRQFLGKTIFCIFQEPRLTLDPHWTIAEQLNEVRAINAAAQSSEHYLSLVDLPLTTLTKLPSELSVGMCQRVQIAMALASGATYILADEPLARIDPGQKKSVLKALTNLKAANSGILLVTHNPELVAQIATHLLVLNKGKTVDSGAIDQILDSQHASPYFRQYMQIYRDLRESGRALQCEPDSLSEGLKTVDSRPTLQQDKPRSDNEAGNSEELLLRAQQVSFTYSRKRGFFGKTERNQVLDSVDLAIRPRETLALVGESGGGKTTLARLCAGLNQSGSGQITLNSGALNSVYASDRPTLSWRLQLVFQEADQSMDPLWTVAESLDEAYTANFGDCINAQQRLSLIAEICAALGLSHEHLTRTPAHLSGGEKKRAALARALAALGWGLSERPVTPGLLILDEPLSGLDPILQSLVTGALIRAKEELNLSLLWISHDLKLMRGLADRIAVFFQGRIVEHSHSPHNFEHPYSQLLASPLTNDLKTEITAEQPQKKTQLANCVYYARCPLEKNSNCTEQGSVPVLGRPAVACQLLNSGQVKSD